MFQDNIIFIFTALRRVMYMKMEAVYSTETSVHVYQIRLQLSATCLQQFHLHVSCIHLLLILALTIILIYESGLQYVNLVSL